MNENIADITECSRLVKWIQSRTLLNRSGLCLAAGIDRGNLDKFILKGSIPKKHMPKLVAVLKDYGYGIGSNGTEHVEIGENVEKIQDKHYIKPNKINKLRKTTPKLPQTVVLPRVIIEKPMRLPGEMSLDYKLRIAAWEETLK